MSADQITAYERALAASHELRAADDLIRLLCALAPTDEPFCNGCLWSAVVKPLAHPLVGWERGHPATAQAIEPLPVGELPKMVNLGDEWFGRRGSVFDPTTEAPPVPADNPTEEWLRTEEAWNAVTGVWGSLLDDADPGLGHGFPRGVSERVAR